MAILPPTFLNSVAAIGNRAESGDISWVATGFFYGSKVEEPEGGWGEAGIQVWLWLVTNRHVVNLLTSPVVRIDSKSGPVLELDLNMVGPTGAPLWITHPDPEVDVAITPINEEFLRQAGASFTFFQHGITAATLDELKTAGVSEGHGGFLLGFPMAIVSGPTNAVIARKSCIAKIRDTYEGSSKSILIDGAVFPGNSGGAAVLHPELMAVTGTQPLNRALLIGVVASYVPYIDVAISSQTQRARITFEENSGLTHVFPVDFIDETAEAANAIRPATDEQAQVPSSDVD